MDVDPWAEAIREARERELGYVGTDLLLLALSRTDGPAGQVLRDLGATPEKVLQAMDGLGWQPAPDLDDTGRQWPRSTPAAEHARGRAEGIALGLGKKESQVDLLLALAYDRYGVHASTLGQLGIDAARVVATLRDRGIPVPSITPAPPPEPHPIVLVLPLEQRDVVLRVLEKETLADPERFFDAWGGGRWGSEHHARSAGVRIHRRYRRASAFASLRSPLSPRRATRRRPRTRGRRFR